MENIKLMIKDKGDAINLSMQNAKFEFYGQNKAIGNVTYGDIVNITRKLYDIFREMVIINRFNYEQ